MNFGNNLQALRKKNHLSQEELAEKLDISRQAISKWEGGTGFPEMEKLLQISELFNCNIDHLLKGTIENDDNLKEKTTRQFQKFGKAVTFGVMLLILGCSLFCFFPNQEEMIVILFFLLVTVAIAIFTYFGIMHDHFTKNNNLSNMYEKTEIDAYQKKFSIGIVIGITIILLAIVVFLLLSYTFPKTEQWESFHVGMLLLFINCSMPFLIYNGIQHSKYEGSEQQNKPKENPLVGKLCGVIMLGATLLYLYFGFSKNGWGTMWYLFPLGGILCGIVGTIFGKEE